MKPAWKDFGTFFENTGVLKCKNRLLKNGTGKLIQNTIKIRIIYI